MKNVNIQINYAEDNNTTVEIINDGVPLSMIRYELVEICNSIAAKLISEADEMQVPKEKTNEYIAARLKVDMEKFYNN